MLAARAAARPSFLIVSSFLNSPPAFGAINRTTGSSFPLRRCTVHVRNELRGGLWSFRDTALEEDKGVAKGSFMRDRSPEQEGNIALLIDADNASPEHLDEVLLVLGE